MNIVLVGAPGSGKGTQARFLSETFSLCPVGMGDLLRREVQEGTDIGFQVKSFMESGHFPDNDLIKSVLEKNLSCASANRFVFDGIPRDLHQAQFLDEVLARLSLKVTAALHLVLPDEEIFFRLSKRLNCAVCSFVLAPQDAMRENPTCPSCQGTVFHRRSDDQKDIIHERLRLHQQKSQPVLDYYQERQLLFSIDGAQSIRKVQDDLKDLLFRGVLTHNRVCL